MALQLKAPVFLKQLSSRGQTFAATLIPMQRRMFTDGSRVADSTEGSLSPSDDTYKSRVIQFSSSRSRDLMGQAIDIQHEHELAESTNDQASTVKVNEASDQHVESYDTRGNLSLNSVMQTMVPEPFSTQGKKAPTHLNMPGGHVQQGQKYLADDLQETHYQRNVRKMSTLASIGNGQVA